MNLSTFSKHFFSFRTRHTLEMDRSLNRNNIFNGFEEEKEKDDQYHHHHHQVGRRFRRRRKAKASLFRETRLNSSVFRIIVSDLNFQNLCARRFPQNLGSLEVYFITRALQKKSEIRSSAASSSSSFLLFSFILTRSLSLSLSDETTTKNAVGIQ